MKLASLHNTIPGRILPQRSVADGHHVHVTIQNQISTLARTAPSADNIQTLVERNSIVGERRMLLELRKVGLQYLCLALQSAQLLRNEMLRGLLVTGQRGEPHQLLQELRHGRPQTFDLRANLVPHFSSESAVTQARAGFTTQSSRAVSGLFPLYKRNRFLILKWRDVTIYPLEKPPDPLLLQSRARSPSTLRMVLMHTTLRPQNS